MVEKKRNEGSAVLDHDKVQTAYKRAFPEIKKAIEQLHEVSGNADAKAHLGRMGGEFARMAAIDWKNLAGSLTGEFCKDWSIVKQALGYMEMLKNVPFLSFVMPSVAAVLGIVAPIIGMIDDSVYPAVCGVGVSTGSAGGTGGQGGTQRG